jgi:DNA-binding transcriptional LysR family regulator
MPYQPPNIQQSNWDDLRIFLVVARYTSLDKAATVLQQNPTTLGRRIRRLEASIDATLFERTRKGHILTASGESMLTEVEKMEHLVAEIDGSIRGEVNRIVGTVRLSVTEGFGNIVIAPALIELIDSYPELKIELVATSGLLSVSKREADMAVLLSRPTRGRLKTVKLTDYHLKLYATPGYLNSRAEIASPDQLREHRLIGYVDDLIYSPDLRYYDEVSSGLKPELTSSSLLAQKQFVSSNCGIAMLPTFIGEQDPTLQQVLGDTVTVTRSFWLAVHEDLFSHARIQAVVHFLQKLVKEKQHHLLT